MSEPIVCVCPHCQVKLKLKNPDLAGQKIKCPKCSEPFVVTPQDAAPPKVASKKPAKAPREEDLPADDDWLNDLDDGNDASSSQPPRVGSKKKPKKTSGGVRPKKRSEEGRDIPLVVHYLMMAGTGLVGGLIGAAIWAALIYFTGFEIGYVAIFVGALSGIGVRAGANRWDYGLGPGLAAVAVAILALIAGKVAGYQLAVRHELKEIAAMAVTMQHENWAIMTLAHEIQDEWPEDTPLSEPENGEEIHDLLDFQAENLPKLFPKEVWTAAKAKWDALPPEEKSKLKQEEAGEFDPDINLDATSMFGPYDILWFFLAISAAYRIATGDDEGGKV